MAEETTYKVEVDERSGREVTLSIGFCGEAENDEHVRNAIAELEQIEDLEGSLVKLNGPASLPVAVALGHKLAHVFGAVAAYDPKLGKYVVSIAHGGEYSPGDLVE
jgi:CRISPR-associated protein Csx3